MIDQHSEHRSKSPNYVSTIQQPKAQGEPNSSTYIPGNQPLASNKTHLWWFLLKVEETAGVQGIPLHPSSLFRTQNRDLYWRLCHTFLEDTPSKYMCVYIYVDR